MPKNGGQRAAARPADIGSASRPRAVRRENGELPAEASVEAGRSMMDLEFLRGLIEAVDSSGIDSLEINRAGTKIRIAKTPPPAPIAGPAAMSAASHFVPATQLASPAEAALVAGEPVQESHLSDVKSPMVGTFYRAPAPEAPPYVEIGSVVKKGQTLCILEAMKLMNELESEVDGIVREILVENADPVEYGQVLFRIDPA
jgi:acetyl-CoA carboxylase biotin carboxyl carrier protein